MTTTRETRTQTIGGHEFLVTFMSGNNVKVHCNTCDVAVTSKSMPRKQAQILVREHHTGVRQDRVTTERCPDGTGYIVKVNGETRGKVAKTTHETTITSAIMGVPGPARWIPEDIAGIRLASMQDTRERAVSLVVKCTANPSVDGVRVETYYGRKFVAAYLNYRGAALGVSRYADEDVWIVDSLTRPGAFMPEFCNGAGTRCTRAQYVKDPFMVSLLDTATADARASLTA